MARFTTAGGSGDGTPGAPGPAGSNGADAIWNYTGEYSGGSAYAVGDLATYDGQLWYRANANGGNVGDTPAQGFIWNLLAAKGTDGTNGSSGLVYLGNYIPGNGYITDLAVVRGSDNNLYIAKANGGLADPVGNTAEWDIFSTNTGGGTANIADFVFTNVDETNSSITVTGNKELTIQSGSSEDLNVRAGDDLWLTADDNILVQADDELNLRSQDSTTIITNYVDYGDGQYEWHFGSQGYLTLPGGGEIINSPDSSGDGSGYSTLQLDPDNTLETDQYIIIDPTGPNHVHIRAGGEIDQSTADVILGGELNNVWVSDSSRRVSIGTRPEAVINSYVNDNLTSSTTFVTNNASDIIIGSVVNIGGTDYVVDAVTSNSPTEGLLSVTASGAMFTSGSTYTFVYEPPYTNYWQFGADGYLTGPAMGGLFVNGILNGEGDLWLSSNDNVVLNGNNGGEFIGDPNNADNQIATIGDLPTGATGSFTSQDGKTVTVTNGIITSIV
jgi:hypothetical protein